MKTLKHSTILYFFIATVSIFLLSTFLWVYLEKIYSAFLVKYALGVVVYAYKLHIVDAISNNGFITVAFESAKFLEPYSNSYVRMNFNINIPNNTFNFLYNMPLNVSIFLVSNIFLRDVKYFFKSSVLLLFIIASHIFAVSVIFIDVILKEANINMYGKIYFDGLLLNSIDALYYVKIFFVDYFTRGESFVFAIFALFFILNRSKNLK